MDEIVAAALRKWPNVPDCVGWLALDARGDWYMRDERVQAAGPFPQVKGSRITHEKLLAFIGRNYALDARGAAYFQNGPQRVYVTLEATPWVWRVARDGAQWSVSAHTGQPAVVHTSWLDERGHLYLGCDLGFGLVHSLDMAEAAEAVESGLWQPALTEWNQLPAQFGFVRQPEGR